MSSGAGVVIFFKDAPFFSSFAFLVDITEVKSDCVEPLGKIKVPLLTGVVLLYPLPLSTLGT